MDDKTRQGMIELAITRLPANELSDLLKLAETALAESSQFREDSSILGVLRNTELSIGYKTVAVLLNRMWRAAAQAGSVTERTNQVRDLAQLRERLTAAYVAAAASAPAPPPADASAPPAAATIEDAIIKVYRVSVGRNPAPEEIEIWKGNFANGLPFHQFLMSMSSSPEAQSRTGQMNIMGERSDGEFIQYVYELMYGRGCTARELEYWVSQIASGAMQRADVLAAVFGDAVKIEDSGAANALHDGLSFQVMGKSQLVTVDDWKDRSRELPQLPDPATVGRYTHRFHIKSAPRFLVTAIASLYRGGDFIEQFMDNITSQNGFDDYCELVIVDADSPENEAETIKRYVAKHKGINYIRINYRLGIYDAWNVGAKVARGEYLTNTNLDDLRRKDSLELQAGVLDNLPFVDVTYQEFYYTFDPRLNFEQIARMGYKSDLPIITPYNLMEFNPPHNAPMWRKSLHDELGYFNTQLKSAGDYEFWMRCAAAGKCFYKVNDPHVAYYQNPKGLSTRPDTRGVVEANEIRKTYGRKLISENLVMPFDAFCREKLPEVPHAQSGGTRNRYDLAQLALRNAARRKYSATSEIRK